MVRSLAYMRVGNDVYNMGTRPIKWNTVLSPSPPPHPPFFSFLLPSPSYTLLLYHGALISVPLPPFMCAMEQHIIGEARGGCC